MSFTLCLMQYKFNYNVLIYSKNGYQFDSENICRTDQPGLNPILAEAVPCVEASASRGRHTFLEEHRTSWSASS